MSNFLAGVVWRGAGIPSPVAMRPALPLQEIPLPVSPVAGIAEEFRQESRTSSQASTGSVEPLRLSPVTPDESRAEVRSASEERSAPAPRPEPRTVVTEPSRRETSPSAIGLVVRNETIPQPMLTPHPAESERQPIHPAGRMSPAPIELAPLAPAPVPEIISTPAAQAAKQSEQKPESAVAVEPSPAAAPHAREHAPKESRNIHVKIGKVEIRTTQPSVPAARPRAKGGFEDFALARTYLDRSSR